jgi:hypothetical protein
MTVPLISIDSFLHKRDVLTPVSFIKIDVQGYEQPACEGAAQTLARNPECTVVLEYMPSAIEALGFRPPDLLAWFEQREYRAHVVHHDGTVTAGAPLGVGSRGYVDLLFSHKAIGE